MHDIFPTVLFPWAIPLMKKLGMQITSKKVLNFFVNNTREIIKLRQESNVVRTKFGHLLDTGAL